jgi:hypothetical protein
MSRETEDSGNHDKFYNPTLAFKAGKKVYVAFRDVVKNKRAKSHL